MSKAKFAAAKELIDEKKYDEARSILGTIDHPVARQWEAKIDSLSPRVSQSTKPGNSYIYNIIRVIAVVFIAVILVALILRQMQQTQQDMAAGQAGVIEALTTINSPASTKVVSTSTAISVAINAATPALAASVTATSTPTITPSITASPTFTITPTYTQVPPSVTPVKLEFSDNKAKVIGPVEIPAGIYRAIATTTGYLIEHVTALSGECGAGTNFLSEGVFSVSSGEANNGAETIFTSKGCSALIEVSNTQTEWKISFELVPSS